MRSTKIFGRSAIRTAAVLGIAFIALVIVSVIAIYLFRQNLIDAGVERLARQYGIDELDVRLGTIDKNQVTFERLTVSDANQNGKIRTQLFGVQLSYSLFPVQLSNVKIREAVVDIRDIKLPENQNNTDSGGFSLIFPVVPAKVGSIESFRLKALLPDAEVGFDGRLEWQADENVIDLLMADAEQRIDVKMIKDAREVQTSVSVESVSVKENTQVARFSVRETDPKILSVDFNVDLLRMRDWMMESSLIRQWMHGRVPEVDLKSAVIEGQGTLDLAAGWSVRNGSFNVDWNTLRMAGCDIDGALVGSVESLDAKTALVRFEAPGTVRVRGCTNTKVLNLAVLESDIELESGSTFAIEIAGDHIAEARIDGAIVARLQTNRGEFAFNASDFNASGISMIDGSMQELDGSLGFEFDLRNVDLSDFLSATDPVNAVASKIKSSGHLTLSGNGARFGFNLHDPVSIDLVDAELSNSDVSVRLPALTVKASGQLFMDSTIDVTAKLDGSVSDAVLGITSSGEKITIADARFNADLQGETSDLAVTLDYQGHDIESDSTGVSSASMSGKAELRMADTVQLSGTGNLQGVRLQDWPETMTVDQVNSTITLNEDQLSLSGTVSLFEDAKGSWQYEKNDVQGDAIEFELTSDIAPLLYWSRPLSGVSLEPLSVSAGNMNLDGRVVFGRSEDSRSKISMSIVLEDTSGVFEEITFNDSSVLITSEDALKSVFAFSANVASGQFASATDYQELDVRGVVESERAILESVDVTAIGARIGFNDLTVNYETIDGDTVLNIRGLEIAQLLEELGRDDVDGTGSLVGNIPISVRNSALIIRNGRLESTGSGTITYRPTAGAIPENVDNVALQALENFQYDKLLIVLNYDETGSYVANLRLEGRNPDLYDGYPIAFNLNLNGQLPSLILSMLIGGKFEEEIFRRIRAQENL